MFSFHGEQSLAYETAIKKQTEYFVQLKNIPFERH